MRLSGLVVPTPTLFDDDGAIDPDRNRRFVEGLVREGVEHVFPLGSLGEFPSVEEAERTVLLRAVIDGLRGSADAWVGVGAPATGRAVARARVARELGAAGVIAVPPYYLRPTEAAVAEYYRAIRRGSDGPLLAYNIPSLVGYRLMPTMVHALAREGVLDGVKDTSGSLESVVSFLADAPTHFAVLPGDDVLALPALAAGAAGAIMGLANVVPRLGLDLVAAGRTPTDDGTRHLQSVVERLAQVVGAGPFPSTGKFLARQLRGAPDGYRLPYGPLTDDEARRVVAALAPLRAELEPLLRRTAP